MEDFNNFNSDEKILYLPFSITSEDSKKILKKNLSFFSLIPFSLTKDNIYSKEKAVYIPLNMYNFSIKGDVTFTANDILKKWKDKNKKYKEVNSYNVKYNCSFLYEKVLSLKTSNINDYMFSNLDFDLNSLKEDSINNLNDILIDDISEEESFEKTKQKVLNDSLKRLKNYDEHMEKKVNLNTLEVSVLDKKKVFLPIFIYNFNFKNKEYMIIINGQTKKIIGNFPTSKVKLSFFSLVIFLIIFTISFLIAYFL